MEIKPMVKNSLIVLLLILVTSLTCYARQQKNYGSVTVNKIISVYDGDTFTVNIKGLHPIIGKRISIRINGIDTPEIRCSKKKKGAEECKRLKQLARTAKKLLENQLTKAKVVELRNIKRGKYFRIVADVFADGKNVADIMIKNGLAKPYDGGTKNEW